MTMVGVTMRVDRAPAYPEWRDGLDQAWGPWLREQLPGVRWLPLPNRPESFELARELPLAGLILSGGNDLGDRPERDDLEASLLGWATAERRPVLAICRGLQRVATWYGGSLAPCQGHVGQPHDVTFVRDWEPAVRAGQRCAVNSYHSWGLRDLPAPLEALAVDTEGWVEAALGPGILGLMWHPEREDPSAAVTHALVARWAEELVCKR